jgi:hypothetical protein
MRSALAVVPLVVAAAGLSSLRDDDFWGVQGVPEGASWHTEYALWQPG